MPQILRLLLFLSFLAMFSLMIGYVIDARLGNFPRYVSVEDEELLRNMMIANKSDEHISTLATQSMSSQRLLLAKQVCNNKTMLRRRTASHLPTLIVEDKHKLLYCLLPKAGCTNWNRIMIGLSGRFNMSTAMNLSEDYIHKRTNQNRLANHSPTQLTYKLRSYTKFMFVREPMERLVSAYKDKFVKPNTYYPKAVGKRIIKAHRVNASDESLKRGHDVTFSEFVRFLLTQNKLGNPLDWHWDLQSRVCKPCLVDYDFIGTQETITKDTEELIRIAHIENVFSEKKVKSKKTTSDIIQETFIGITDHEKRQLIEMYSVDYAMFGYPIPTV